MNHLTSTLLINIEKMKNKNSYFLILFYHFNKIINMIQFYENTLIKGIIFFIVTHDIYAVMQNNIIFIFKRKINLKS